MNILLAVLILALLGPYPCPVKRDKAGHIVRNAAQRHHFVVATGYSNGRLGYVVDHIIPLCACGPDVGANMQWQRADSAKMKDRVERAACRKLALAVAQAPPVPEELDSVHALQPIP